MIDRAFENGAETEIDDLLVITGAVGVNLVLSEDRARGVDFDLDEVKLLDDNPYFGFQGTVLAALLLLTVVYQSGYYLYEFVSNETDQYLRMIQGDSTGQTLPESLAPFDIYRELIYSLSLLPSIFLGFFYI